MSEYRICPHCRDSVSIKVYKEHERIYYNKDDRSWITVEQLNPPISGDEEDDMLSSPPSVSVNTGQYLKPHDHDQSEYQQPTANNYKLMSRVLLLT